MAAPKLKPAVWAAVVLGVAKEKRGGGWVVAGAAAGVPKVKPPPELADDVAGEVKEKPVGAGAAAVFGVPKLKPPPDGPELPKLNWLMAPHPAGRETDFKRCLPSGPTQLRSQPPRALMTQRARRK